MALPWGHVKRTMGVSHLEALGRMLTRCIDCCYLAMWMCSTLVRYIIHIAWQLHTTWLMQPSPSGLYPSYRYCISCTALTAVLYLQLYRNDWMLLVSCDQILVWHTIV